MYRAISFALAMAAASTGHAVEFTVSVPDAAEVRVVERSYVCDSGGEMVVVFYNADPVFLARFQVDGVTTVAAIIPSASGARYAGGNWVLWEKGQRDVALYRLLDGENSAPAFMCKAGDVN